MTRLTDMDRLRIDMANLEEAMKTLRFELKDHEYGIKAIQAEVAKLRQEMTTNDNDHQSGTRKTERETKKTAR